MPWAPAGDQAAQTLARFRAIARREVTGAGTGGDLPGLPSGTVLITGGTGCVGTRLSQLLAAGGECELVSVSRRPPAPDRAVPGVRYLQADVRDQDTMLQLMLAHQPEMVIHCAAQRDPGLAERRVTQTVSTNVGGTRSVLDAAGAAGVQSIAIASTGKALRYHTLDVYAASKKAAEWLLADAAARWGYRACAVRFTHLVDNSIVTANFNRWLADGEPVALHAPGILMYAQSATEAAQSLLLGLRLATPGIPRVLALNDFAWPVSLDELAAGLAAELGVPSLVRYTGYPRGYEGPAFPGTYGPSTFDASPLLNALEVSLPSYQQVSDVPVDAFTPVLAAAPRARELVGALAAGAGRSAHEDRERGQLAALLRLQLEALALAVPPHRLAEVLRLADAGDLTVSPHFQDIYDVIRGASAA